MPNSRPDAEGEEKAGNVKAYERREGTLKFQALRETSDSLFNGLREKKSRRNAFKFRP